VGSVIRYDCVCRLLSGVTVWQNMSVLERRDGAMGRSGHS
jgi:hypothetical protein